MNAVVSIVLLAAVLGVIVFLLSRRENGRRSQYGPAGLSEFRTDLALDECFDRLDEHNDSDVFVYDCRRERDGGFLLHLTLHQPTQQPLDTLYTLRLDPGRHPRGLWLQGAAVPAGDAGRIHGPEAGRPPHPVIFAGKGAFHLPQNLLY